MSNVLLVDDDALLADRLETGLQFMGLNVTSCIDLTTAVEKLRYNRYSALLLDVQIGARDVVDYDESIDGRYSGLLFLQRLRDGDFGDVAQRTPVLLITNWRGDSRVATACAKFNAQVAEKPLKIRELADRLQQISRR